jgi:hypothetical protein
MNWHTSLAVHRPTSRPRAWQGIAAGLVRVAAGRAPGGLSERLEEEWLAIIPELDGALARLRFALGCLWAATMIHAEPRRRECCGDERAKRRYSPEPQRATQWITLVAAAEHGD